MDESRKQEIKKILDTAVAERKVFDVIDELFEEIQNLEYRIDYLTYG